MSLYNQLNDQYKRKEAIEHALGFEIKVDIYRLLITNLKNGFDIRDIKNLIGKEEFDNCVKDFENQIKSRLSEKLNKANAEIAKFEINKK